jgi:hypothetical protein
MHRKEKSRKTWFPLPVHQRPPLRQLNHQVSQKNWSLRFGIRRQNRINFKIFPIKQRTIDENFIDDRKANYNGRKIKKREKNVQFDGQKRQVDHIDGRVHQAKPNRKECHVEPNCWHLQLEWW